MSLFDSGIVNFIKLLIIIGLISMLYMVVMQKIKEQNHKITSLLSLVTTMATEINSLKQGHVKETDFENGVKAFDNVFDDAKDDISDDSGSDTESDSESEPEFLDFTDKINFFESSIQELETEPEQINVSGITENEITEITEITEINENVLEDVSELETFTQFEENSDKPNYKKMNITKLVEVVVSKKLTSAESAKKLKKNELLNLLN